MSTRRKPIVAGNWKMNLDAAKARSLTEAVAARAGEAGNVDLVLCPPALYATTVAAALGLAAGNSPSGVAPSGVALGGQNAHDKESGAFTGEVAPGMLRDIGSLVMHPLAHHEVWLFTFGFGFFLLLAYYVWDREHSLMRQE
jgi:triosephosphate isomerase